MGIMLSSCGGSSGNSSATAASGPITGTVLVADGDTSLAADTTAPRTLLAKVLRFFFQPGQAAITGLVPLPSVQVQLIRVDSTGAQIGAPLATTTSDLIGNYTFANPPPYSSTLMVQVDPLVLPSARAIASRGNLDITPQSESVVATVLANGTGLTHYDTVEINDLYDLVDTLNIDLAGQTFAAGVTTVGTASSPVIPDLARAFDAVSRAALPAQNSYVISDLMTTLVDPTVLPASGGIRIEQENGGFGFDSKGVTAGGSISIGGLLHDLSTVSPGPGTFINLAGTEHVIVPTGQLAISTSAGIAVSGFATVPDYQLLAYPLDQPGVNPGDSQGLGLRVAIPQFVSTPGNQFDGHLFEGTYNLVGFENRVFGPASSAGVARFESAITTGTLSVPVQNPLPPQSTPRPINSVINPASVLGIDLSAAPFLVTTNAAGNIRVPTQFSNGLNDARFFGPFGDFVGAGQITPDGQILAFYTAQDLFQNELDVLANDSDAAGDTLTIITPINSITAGTATISDAADKIFYTPPGNPAPGGEQLTYSIQDSQGVAAGPFVVNLSFPGAPDLTNDPPLAIDDGSLVSPLQAQQGTATNIAVLTNDSDAVGDVLSVDSIATAPLNGAAAINGSTITYTSNPLYTGPDSFTYLVRDSSAAVSATPATVFLNVVVAGNTAPVAVNDGTALVPIAVNTGASNAVLKVLANDTDVDVNDTLTIASITQPTNGSAAISTGNTTILYTPGAAGAASLTYTVTDGTATSAPATVFLNVGANAAPVGTADAFTVNNQNSGSRGMILALRQATAATASTLNGTYNIVSLATLLSNDAGPTTGFVDGEYAYGTITFDGLGNVTGNIVKKRASLNASLPIPALAILPAAGTPDAISGTYAVNADGTVTATLTVGADTLTANGAVTQDGRFAALTLQFDGTLPTRGKRGIMLLGRQ